jgi:hypothetical protein
MDHAWNHHPVSHATSGNPDNSGTKTDTTIDDNYSLLQHEEVTPGGRSFPTVCSGNIITTRVLDQFSITAATLITQYGDNEDEMECLIQQFIRQVRVNVSTLTGVRHPP